MNDIDLFKDIYFKEISRKESLDNNYSVNILTILTGITIVVYIYIEKFSSLELERCELIFPIIFFSFGLLMFGTCIYWLAMGFNNGFAGFKYEEFPLLKEMEANRHRFTEDGYNNELRKELLEITSNFQFKNKTRLDYYHNSRKYLVITFLSTAIFVSLYYLIKFL